MFKCVLACITCIDMYRYVWYLDKRLNGTYWYVLVCTVFNGLYWYVLACNGTFMGICLYLTVFMCKCMY